jgi:23S rRNA pseudouridine2605 synthase
MSDKSNQQNPGERIAKVMARAGLASRRQAEAWIVAGRVSVNGAVINSPALNVTPSDRIAVDGQPLRARERTRLFRYHKPRGLVTTNSDPEGRPTIFAALPKDLPRLISVGRLDINTEGLLLLTNDGGLARVLELPATGWLRCYRVRALGRVIQDALDRLRGGITVEGVHYGPIEATLDREQGANVWLTIGIREGKNREVRKVLETLDLKVNRLIRVAFGPFELGELDDGAVEEVKTEELRKQLGPEIAAAAGTDFEAPLVDHTVQPVSPRHLEVRAKQGRAPQDDESPPRRGHPNDKKKQPRRDRTGGPRPKYPRPK